MSTYKPYPYALFENRVIPIEEAQISIMTNALHYGVGIFEGIKAFKTEKGIAIFRLEEHIERMKQNVGQLDFRYEFDSAQIITNIVELARKNKINSTTYIRPIIYRSDTSLSPDIAGGYNLAVYMLDMPGYFDAAKGLDVGIASWRRISKDIIPPKAKVSGGYINSALAIDEAHRSGYDSAIMLDQAGNVSEGAVMNIFLIKDGKLITPSLESDILEGITRRTVLELADEQNIPFNERTVEKEELFSCDEAFFCGTATDITWCRSIDGQNVSKTRGPITTKLAELFAKLPESHPELFALCS